MRVSILLGGIVFCSVVGAAAPDPAWSFSEAAQMTAAKDQIREKLKDPSSAEFKDVKPNNGRGGVNVICGKVNAKNGFGGKNGFQRFISTGLANSTWLEEEVVAKDFNQIWFEYCR